MLVVVPVPGHVVLRVYLFGVSGVVGEVSVEEASVSLVGGVLVVRLCAVGVWCVLIIFVGPWSWFGDVELKNNIQWGGGMNKHKWSIN